MAQNRFFSTLKNRGLIKISGPDRRTFLQGLITNNIHLLDEQPCIYACLLSPQGKFMFDFFITEENKTLVMDCEGGERLTTLAKTLMMYKLRAEATIETEDHINVYAIIGEEYGEKDPRHPDMGYRSLHMPADIDESPFERWDEHRIKLTVPDGSRDLIPQKSTMDEGRMDQLNAVDYDKGCYVGQELTARMHYRGLGKKHLKTIKLIEASKEIQVRSSCGDFAIALIKESPT